MPLFAFVTPVKVVSCGAETTTSAKAITKNLKTIRGMQPSSLPIARIGIAAKASSQRVSQMTDSRRGAVISGTTATAAAAGI